MYQFDSEKMSDNALDFSQTNDQQSDGETLTAHWQQRVQEKIKIQK